MAPAYSRKRKRESRVSSILPWHGDTIAVTPKRSIASAEPSVRQPLTETRTRGNKAAITRNASRVEVPKTHASNDTVSVLSSHEDTDTVIPPDCCVFCRTRGGNAAYECFKEEGEDRCTRCIREKKTKCRLPTSEEVAVIEARCPQCTRRGFKTCDGGDPCDTCKRNKTAHLCRKQPEKKVKREGPPPQNIPSPPPNQEVTVTLSRTRASKRNAVSESNHVISDEQPVIAISDEQPVIANDADLAPDLESVSSATRSSTPRDDADSGAHCNDDDVVMAEDTELRRRAARASNPPINGRLRRSLPRVSYAAQFSDNASDEDVSFDVFSAPETDEDTEMESELPSSEDESTYHSDAESLEVMPLEDTALVEDDDDLEVAITKPPKKKRERAGDPTQTKAEKGIDLSLPPLSDFEECMADITAKAVELGLSKALSSLQGRTIRVATMCSGTESPLIALDAISRALEKQDHPSIQIQHLFSAEIEVFKQAFIERNFHPAILFRDVRDFIREPSTRAVTAYGAEVEIPTNIDILIAGFVCKDLSRLNNSGKTLKDGGESGDTWRAVYTYARRFHPTIVLLENVKSEIATWDDIVSQWDKIGYEAAWVICDTKNYYLPQTRLRMYMMAINRSHCGKGAAEAVGRWKELMRKMERQCSSPYEAFLPDSLKESSGYGTLRSEPDWALCKLRNDHIRSEKRLGILSPISRRSGNGTVMPPDFADRKFYISQSSRVHDAIDIAHLEAAQRGHDSLYKMALWDVSQNVDRFKVVFGIAPCLTPSGQDFASNRQHTLNGSQLLLLQGMPLDRLLLANETQKDLQNLAGNAMSTTVIGASLISAIISGSSAFRTRSPADRQPSVTRELDDASVSMLSRPDLLEHTRLQPGSYRHLNMAELGMEASLSARMCGCEGNKAIGRAFIRLCSACGHTACSSCAGNPKHVYTQVVSRDSRTQKPDEFIKRWRSKLPARLKFDSFPDVPCLLSSMQADDPILRTYLKVVKNLQMSSQYFCISNHLRQQHVWKVVYSSPNATLELQINHKTRWLLFVKCPPDIPGDSPLREFLKSPIAQGDVKGSLLDVEWELRIPRNKAYPLRLSGSPERTSSWRSRLGLADYKEETVPMMIRFQSDNQDLKEITGEYEHLPHCGTASNSLYKKTRGREDLYLFLDPNPIGRSDHDSFVFSHDINRKHYGDSRSILARMDPSWRPWHVEDEDMREVNTTIPAVWLPATIELGADCVSLDVGYLKEGSLDGLAFQDCSQSPLIVLDVFMRERIPIESLSDYYWALERSRSLPLCSSWQSVRSNNLTHCSCAPQYPRLLWSVNGKGVATAQEDRKSAATFERALKTRPQVFQIIARNESTTTRVQVGINVMSMIHRARGRFANSKIVDTSWRLTTDYADVAAQSFAKFRLLSNAEDPPNISTAAPKYLRGTQLQSMSWMATQELGRDVTVTESEEEIHASLGWRIEARAQTTCTVRGGVLADHPSFGKTVTTIALIESEFEQFTPEELISQNRTLAKDSPVLLESAATLIVCPPHIAQQWKSEFEKFLDVHQQEAYKILLIEDYDQLECLTIEDVLESRVIIVSWKLFADEEYITALADFTAMPEPAMTSRRAFDAWMTRTMDALPNQLAVHQTQPYQRFRELTDNLLDDRLQQADFKAIIPLKVQHGSAYQSFRATQSTSKAPNPSKAKDKATSKPKAKGTKRTTSVPLIHLFRFNRLVVDEYHYLNEAKATKNLMAAVGIKKAASHKRWVLSGTPALANFSDVDEIATFLDLKLGRDFFGNGTVTTLTERVRRGDQTDAEKFLSQTQVMSHQWHLARHERAQEFLDLFVRQNEAELQHILCSEELLPVELNAAHHAVYLELSQHLISQRMQVKKVNKKSSSDRNDRLNGSLDGSGSAEEALLKSALLFETEDGKSGIEILMTKRSQQLQSTQSELQKLLAGFEGLMIVETRRRGKDKKNKATAEPSIVDLYGHFKQDITKHNWLGDEEASQRVRELLMKAAQAPKLSFSELKDVSEIQRVRLVKQRLSTLREVALEYAHRTRSKRFIDSIQAHLQSQTGNLDSLKCSSPGCDGIASLDQLHSITHCGHTACVNCLKARLDDESCVSPGCNSLTSDGSLIRMSDLGSSEDESKGQTFGNKLKTIVQLIQALPSDDQGIIFAPNEEIIGILETILDHYGVSYHSPSRNKRTSAKIMEDFKTNNSPKTMKKLLILNLGSESAAGVNLTNANHIIFVAPLLAKTQYEYDSAMAQAIARSRRYGQEKKVHIYHIVAQRTIDVDILEHRHKRNDAIITSSTTTKMPKATSARKETTKLVRNNKAEMMLVPCSWLADESNRKMLGIRETPESFTSLINFSETFEQEDDEPLVLVSS